MKMKDELNALKKEFEAINKKLSVLTDEELAQAAGGALDLPGIAEISSTNTLPNITGDFVNLVTKYRVRNFVEIMDEFQEKLMSIVNNLSVYYPEDLFCFLVFVYEDPDGSPFPYVYRGGLLVWKR